jgi:hypothetical protein
MLRSHSPSPTPGGIRSRRTPTFGALAVGLVVAGACAEAPPPPWPLESHSASALRIGAAAADQLSGTLIQQLSAALDSAGPAGAIGFCSSEALPLTAAVAASMDGVEIKRTGTRIRNPANAPDSLEAEALAYFEAGLAETGALPESWVQTEGEAALRYYRPLVVNAMCVQCHGPATGLSPDVVATLEERYPNDRATGYSPGDFRGLIRVRISREALEVGG